MQFRRVFLRISCIAQQYQGQTQLRGDTLPRLGVVRCAHVLAATQPQLQPNPIRLFDSVLESEIMGPGTKSQKSLKGPRACCLLIPSCAATGVRCSATTDSRSLLQEDDDILSVDVSEQVHGVCLGVFLRMCTCTCGCDSVIDGSLWPKCVCVCVCDWE